ncbi:MAG: tRNA uridine-5-carboxymethylaminomethyl(34) synthesis GTPase MnmE [Candidatus Sumerlaeia bacterium]|nr:tRNA uridine-5-carboxymethylaminomethyl(34) synthesis GTPase MnmE [Candidatus Sumerlaeia bacterium]
MPRPAADPLRAHDTIAAPATAPGAAAIAIVRLSGPAAHAVAIRLFSPHRKADAAPGLLRQGEVRDGSGTPIDDGLLVLWNAPRSATGEDAAEFHLHGSPAVVERVLAACLACGARLADPGEFTRRALLNGRLDLAQAEAVGALARARTDAAARAALGALGGALSQRIAAARAALVPVLAQLEALVDFPDDVDEPLEQRLAADVESVQAMLDALLRTAERGRRLAEGARVVLAGAPNAGKSSLFNALLRRERAITSPHPGTTRDSVEATIDLAGVPLTLVDTAGLRDADDPVEAAGVAVSRRELAGADLALLVVDPAEPPAEPAALEALGAAPFLLVRSKADLAAAPAPLPALEARALGVLAVSAATGAGVAELEARIAAALRAEDRGEGATLVTARQTSAVANAAEHLVRAREALASSLAPEFVAVHLTEALAALDRTAPAAAATLDEELLDAVFSTFCLGK